MREVAATAATSQKGTIPMVRIGILAMAAAVAIVVAGSWLHASASRAADSTIDVLNLTIAAGTRLPVQSFGAI
jgi:hypothetical protein